MSDLFHKDVPDGITSKKMFDVMARARTGTSIRCSPSGPTAWLSRLDPADFLGRRNIWMGVSVEI
jgi:protein gp37